VTDGEVGVSGGIEAEGTVEDAALPSEELGRLGAGTSEEGMGIGEEDVGTDEEGAVALSIG
jgi:hypothetical protein